MRIGAARALPATPKLREGGCRPALRAHNPAAPRPAFAPLWRGRHSEAATTHENLLTFSKRRI